MRSIKKILCVVLTAVMLILSLSTIAMAEEVKFSDVTEDQIFATAVKTLNLMGVINGYPDGTFKPNNDVTRAEFTAMLMRTLQLGTVGSTSAAELPFSDIDDNNSDINWAIPNINTAYGMGIINGYEDGTFRPSASVAYEEAVKMIVCALGYGVGVDTSTTPWYQGYLTIAAQNGITKTASKIGSPENPATRACIAQLLYDSLEVRIVENDERTDKTILNDYLGYQKCTGIIYSNDVTSLSSPDVNLRDGEIQIYAKEGKGSDYELHTYNISDESLMDYIGYEVEFYYTSDGSDDRTLMLYVVKDSEPLTVSAANIEVFESTETEIAYYEDRGDSKSKTIRLESDNIVIYNDKLYGYDEASSVFDVDMVPEVGQLTFLDSDNNGRYDIIKIDAYEVFYVSNKANATYEIIDNMLEHKGSKSIKLNTEEDSNLSIVNKDGDEIKFSSIATGNIVCVAKNNSGSPVTKAVVLNDKVTGTITASSGDKITISGKSYYYSPVAPWVTGTEVDEPRTQDDGVYYLDMNGDIVAYSTSAVNENVKYGFIMGYTESEDFDSEIAIRVLSSNGTVEDFGTYKSTKINGDGYSTGEEVIEELKKTATNADPDIEQFSIQQLVKYTTKSTKGKNVLDKIYTAKPASKGGEVVSDGLMMLSTIEAGDKAEYSSSTKTLAVGTVKVTVSNSIIFSIPEDRRAFDEYRISTVTSSFKNGVDNYSVEAFDVTATNNAKVVVSYGADNSQAVSTESPLYIVDEMSEARDSDGTMLAKVLGYKVSMDSSFNDCDDWISDDSDNAFSLDTGDIFRAGTDRKGYALYEKENLIYSPYGNNEFKIYRDEKEAETDIMEAEYIVILGSVVARDDNAIVVVPQELSMGDTYGTDEDDENDQEYIFNASAFSSATALIYDTDGSDLELVEESNCEDALAMLNSSIEDSDPSKVLIYLSEGRIKLFCVLPQE